MFTNLFEQAKLPIRPTLPTLRQPKLVTPFPTEAEVRAFTLEFSNAAKPKEWLETQQVGEQYSTNVIEADFLQCFARMYLVNTAHWQRTAAGERFCEVMRDLCDLAQRAGVR